MEEDSCLDRSVSEIESSFSEHFLPGDPSLNFIQGGPKLPEDVLSDHEIWSKNGHQKVEMCGDVFTVTTSAESTPKNVFYTKNPPTLMKRVESPGIINPVKSYPASSILNEPRSRSSNTSLTSSLRQTTRAQSQFSRGSADAGKSGKTLRRTPRENVGIGLSADLDKPAALSSSTALSQKQDVSPSSKSCQSSSINTDAGDKSAISELNDLFVSGLVEKALTISSQKLQNSAHSLVSKSKNPRESLCTVYRSPVISPTESLKSPNKSLSSSIKSPLISCSLTRSVDKSSVKSSAACSPLKSLSCTEYKENLELDQRVGQPQLVHQPSYSLNSIESIKSDETFAGSTGLYDSSIERQAADCVQKILEERNNLSESDNVLSDLPSVGCTSDILIARSDVDYISDSDNVAAWKCEAVSDVFIDCSSENVVEIQDFAFNTENFFSSENTFQPIIPGSASAPDTLEREDQEIRNYLSVIEEATEQSSLSSQSIDPGPIPSQSIDPCHIPSQSIDPSPIPSQSIYPCPIPSQSIKLQKLGSQSIKQTERHLSPPGSKSNLVTGSIKSGSQKSQLLPSESRTKSKNPVRQFSTTLSQDFDLDCAVPIMRQENFDEQTEQDVKELRPVHEPEPDVHARAERSVHETEPDVHERAERSVHKPEPYVHERAGRSVHKPRILNSPRDVNNPSRRQMQKFGSLIESLPSRSNPSTPRDSDSERSEIKPRFIQNKSRVQSNKRYIRSSPPRETTQKPVPGKTGSPVEKTGLHDDSFLYNTPIQTRTGLTLTQTNKDKGRMYRSASSAEIEKSGKVGTLNRKSAKLDRSKSVSSSSIHQSKSSSSNSILQTKSASNSSIFKSRKPDFSHVESKVKQYIQTVSQQDGGNLQTRLEEKFRPNFTLSNKSKSCGNLSPSKSVVCLVGSNPKNSLTSLTLKSYPSCCNLEDRGQRSRSEPPEDNKLGSQSKSNPNLSQQLCVRTNLSKSAISLGVRDFDTIFDPEDSDYETKARYFSRDGLDEIVIEPEDLLHMVFQERKGKQEAKKVLDELKSNYENLLQKFAAAENALDVVRFGGQPPPVDESREQTFRLADDFADRIGQFKVEESDLSLIESRNMKIRTSTSQSGEGGGDNTQVSLNMTEVQRTALEILNKGIQLEMGVRSGVLVVHEGLQGVQDLSSSLDFILHNKLEDLETRDLLLEAARKLDEIKLYLTHQSLILNQSINPSSTSNQSKQETDRNRNSQFSDEQHKDDSTRIIHTEDEPKTCKEEIIGPYGDTDQRVEGLNQAHQDYRIEEETIKNGFSKNITKADKSRCPAPLMEVIEKVERWRKNIPGPSYYSSLPSSPTPSQDIPGVSSRVCPPVSSSPLDHIQSSPLDLDSGCPGSDRSTLWTSTLQHRGLSPKSKVGSRENVGTPLYNVVEEEGISKLSGSAQTTHRSAVCSLSDVSHQSPTWDQLNSQGRKIPSELRTEVIFQPQQPANQSAEKLGSKNQSELISPNRILSLDNRFISSVIIERGIKLSPRAAEQAKQLKYSGLSSNSEQGWKQGGLSKETYSGFEKSLTVKQTSTPNRKLCMKRSTAMFDLKSANNPDLNSPEPELYLTDLTTDEADKVLGLSEDDQSGFGLSEADLNIVPPNHLSVQEQFSLLLSTPKKKTPSHKARMDPEYPERGGYKIRTDPEYPEGSGYKNVLAEQIDNEILELRSFFDDHREEMMSMLQGPQEQYSRTQRRGGDREERISSSGSNINTKDLYRSLPYSTRFSGLESRSSPGARPGAGARQYESDSAAEFPQGLDRTLMLRRIEFERRRMRKELKKRKRNQQMEDRGVKTGYQDTRMGAGYQNPRMGVGYQQPQMRAGYQNAGKRRNNHEVDNRNTLWPFHDSDPTQFQGDNEFHDDYVFQDGHVFQESITNSEMTQKSISAFFPLQRHSHRVDGSGDDSFPSLPDPNLVYPGDIQEDNQRREEERLEVDDERLEDEEKRLEDEKRLVDEEKMLEDAGESWKHDVPELDLEDIWSDVTGPRDSFDLSSHSLSYAVRPNQPSCPSPIPETGEPDYHTSFNIDMRNSTLSVECRSSRSVGCDTLDLGPGSNIQYRTEIVHTPGRSFQQSSSQPSFNSHQNPLDPILSSVVGLDPTLSSNPVPGLLSSRSHVVVLSPRDPGDLRRTVSVADLENTKDSALNLSRLMGSHSPVIIINQTCAHRNLREEAPKMRAEGRKSSLAQQAESSRRRKQKKKDINKQNLSSVLKSLDAADQLAQRLKLRSEHMLEILATEISSIHGDIEI